MKDSVAHKALMTYTEARKKEFLDWIYSAKTYKTKVERIAATLDRLVKKS